MANNSLHTAALNSTLLTFYNPKSQELTYEFAEQYGLVRSLVSQDPTLVNAVDEV